MGGCTNKGGNAFAAVSATEFPQEDSILKKFCCIRPGHCCLRKTLVMNGLFETKTLPMTHDDPQGWRQGLATLR